MCFRIQARSLKYLERPSGSSVIIDEGQQRVENCGVLGVQGTMVR